eukprot:scaffold35078_cov14-Tisochrysis_lutea.AAC.1
MGGEQTLRAARAQWSSKLALSSHNECTRWIACRNAASGGFAGFSFPTLPKPINVGVSRQHFTPRGHQLEPSWLHSKLTLKAAAGYAWRHS